MHLAANKNQRRKGVKKSSCSSNSHIKSVSENRTVETSDSNSDYHVKQTVNGKRKVLPRGAAPVSRKSTKSRSKNSEQLGSGEESKEDNSVNFVAECFYKTVTFSPQHFSERLNRLQGGISGNNNSDHILQESSSSSRRSSSTTSSSRSSSVSSTHSFQSSLMLSAEERQELAENAMEQLATGLNRAAETMQGPETGGGDDPGHGGAQPVPDVAELQDQELYQLLEEAYAYKRPKDRQGKSEMFRELLEKAEENSSGEEQWDINFRKFTTQQDTSGKKKKKRVSESNKKGGSLSNLSNLSDFESGSGKSSSKSKKQRSSVSSRSREGGSLPPTKFENVMLYEAANNSHAWDSTTVQTMPEEACLVTPGELQPLLHSTSDTALRRRVQQTLGESPQEAVAIDMEGLGECDTDSNKTEVEEIEMVDMEGRDPGDDDDMTAARHRLETRQDWDNREERERSSGGDMDENGNPTQRHIHPIMNNVRPVSIYRHTPVFRPQKLTVPHTVHNSSSTSGYGSTAPVNNGLTSQQDSVDRNKDSKRKNRKKKNEEEKNVVKAEDIEGYRGNKDIDSLLEFLGEGEETKKKTKKAGDKPSDKNTKKVTNKSDNPKEDQKVRKKKERSQEKETSKPPVTKKLSIETIDNDVIEEDTEEESTEKRENSEETENNSLRHSISPEKDSPYTSILETEKTPASAPSSNDSGHVSAGPYSLPSISSTKEMSIASSPPLDLDPHEFSEEGYRDIVDLNSVNNEFTQVTKKRKKKTKRSPVYPPGSHEAARASSQGPETVVEAGAWSLRGYMRGSREAVSGSKSTCSVPPSEASDTDDHDSVHSLPVGSTRTKVSVSVASVSSGHTPHASYADIARHAAALITQQQGQQQHAVYREQLQFRETTPSNAKESVSSNEDYFYNPDLDNSFPPVSATVADNVTESSSHNNNVSNTTDTVTSEPNNNPDTDSLTQPESHPNLGESPSDNNPSSSCKKIQQNKSDSNVSLQPPVVILQTNESSSDLNETSGFTFGFEVNESLLAMSFDVNVNGNIDQHSDTLNNGDNHVEIENESSSKGLVFNQSYEDSEMMKKLLLCSESTDELNDESGDTVRDMYPVLSVQPQMTETLNLNKFNYDVIVHFVRQAWEVVNKEMQAGRPVCYYSS